MASPAGDARLEEQADTLYALYERQARAFRTALISVMSLITIVLALVFYPYVTFRGERYALEAEQEKIGKALAQAERVLAEAAKEMEEYHQTMQSVGRRIIDLRPDALQTAAAEHARILADIKTALAGDPAFDDWLSRATAGKEPPLDLRQRHPELRQGGSKPCFWLMGDAWLRCALKEALSEVDSTAVKQYKLSRVAELRRALFGDFADALGALRNSFAAYLLSSETTWRLDAAAIAAGMSDQHRVHLRVNSDDWTRQLDIPGTLKKQTERYVGLYLQLLEAHDRYVIETNHRLRDDVLKLGREKARIEGELHVIVTKLEGLKGLQDVETPFGTLPVGINELVLLFPILVAAGFMFTASLFVESLELRGEYHLLTRLTDPDGEALPDRRVALIAPLWIDPLKPVAHRVYRGVILGLPVLAFVGAIWLLARNGLLTGPFIKEARLNEVIYFGLYIASAVAILEGSRRTARALRRHVVNGRMEAEPKSTQSDHNEP
jgi:F0F1-type ATP synthase membrane subunit b/b'